MIIFFFGSLICSEKSEEAVGVSLCFSLCCITYSDSVDRVQILYNSFLLHGSPHQHYRQHELASSWGLVSLCELLHYVHVLVSAFLMGARRRDPEIHMVMLNHCCQSATTLPSSLSRPFQVRCYTSF